MSERPRGVIEQRVGKVGNAVFITTCALVSLFYIYVAAFGTFGRQLTYLAPLMAIGLVYVFLSRPFLGKLKGWALAFDLLLVLLAVGTVVWAASSDYRPDIVLGSRFPEDHIAAGILMVIILEASRRAIGWILPVLGIAFLLFTRYGDYMPGVLWNPGFSWRLIIEMNGIMTNGIWGIPIYVCATIVIMFMIFSAFLDTAGGLSFFTEIASSLLGGFRGGPAKIAVVASGLFGMISGSVIANVSAVGTFTIPLMKRTGFSPETAAAVEAVASTGGQIMPPVMGAAAFIMAEFLNVSYWQICVAAFLPAVLYFAALFAAVHFKAVKANMPPLPKEERPRFRDAMKRGWFLIVPLVVLIYALGVMKWSPDRSALAAVLSLFVVGMPFKRSRMGPRRIFHALVQGTQGMGVMVAACALAGIVVGSLNLSGIALGLTQALIDISGGSALVLLILTAIALIILSMGIPTTPLYIFIVLLMGPAIKALGFPLIAAHMFVFWYALLSSITPPVAMAVYASSAIAQARVMRTGLIAVRIAAVLFVVPFFFVYNNALLLIGSVPEVLLAAVTSVTGTVAFAAAIEGCLMRRLGIPSRLLLGIGGLALIWPGAVTDLLGAGLIGGAIILQLRDEKGLFPWARLRGTK